jgi:hypothetical protein
MTITNLPPLGGYGDDEPQHAPVYDINRRCAHADCRAPLLRDWLYPLCRLCKDAECLVCGGEIVPVDGYLCDACRWERVELSHVWKLLRHDYRKGVYQS